MTRWKFFFENAKIVTHIYYRSTTVVIQTTPFLSPEAPQSVHFCSVFNLLNDPPTQQRSTSLPLKDPSQLLFPLPGFKSPSVLFGPFHLQVVFYSKFQTMWTQTLQLILSRTRPCITTWILNSATTVLNSVRKISH